MSNVDPTAPDPSQPAPGPQAAEPDLRFGQLVAFSEEYPEHRVRYGLVVAVHSDPDAPDRAEVVWLGERSGPLHAADLEVVEED